MLLLKTRSRFQFIFSAIVIPLIVSSCASLQTSSSKEFAHSIEQRSRLLLQVEDWHAKGKIGLSFPLKDKTKLVSASFEWKHRGKNFDIRFFGPLGMGEFILKKQTSYTILTNHKGKQFYARSPEELFQSHAGVEVPWELISYWIKGIAAPDLEYDYEFDKETGVLTHIAQAEWDIHYISWSEHQTIAMPNKLKISQGDTSATLIVRDWYFTAPLGEMNEGL